MQVGIITIIENDNYGNRLQNYAIQEYLSKMNIKSITFKNHNYSNTKKLYLLRKIKYLNNAGTYSANINRKNNFLNFNKYINFSKNVINAYTKDRKDIDFYIVGSDQVWNPNFGRMREVDLLQFAEPKKRIALSPSFGVDSITCDYKLLKRELSKFKSISVREESGNKIIKDIVGRDDAEVLIDPTMLLTVDDWDKVSKRPNNLKTDKYILNYFLGDLSLDKKNEIDKIAKDNDCIVIDILDEDSPFYECGPSEFLYLEKNAFLICTDSFHSCVFAILYNRPFFAFEREQKGVISMNSRIDTLLSKFNLSDRKCEKLICEKSLNCNYAETNKLLEKERNKVKIYLEGALNIKDSDY